jgi:hypothetical protein
MQDAPGTGAIPAVLLRPERTGLPSSGRIETPRHAENQPLLEPPGSEAETCSNDVSLTGNYAFAER